MNLIEDKAQKEGQHEAKNNYWVKNGIKVERFPLPVGDYIVKNEKVADVIERKSKRGVEIKKMDFLGTYDRTIDSKFSIQELVSDICGKSHERFRDECILAQNNGIKLIILIENEHEVINARKGIENSVVTSIDDLFRWKNKRAFIWRRGSQLYPKSTKGATLAKACKTMQEKYGVEFRFCDKRDSGRIILELLGVNVDGK